MNRGQVEGRGPESGRQRVVWGIDARLEGRADPLVYEKIEAGVTSRPAMPSPGSGSYALPDSVRDAYPRVPEASPVPASSELKEMVNGLTYSGRSDGPAPWRRY